MSDVAPRPAFDRAAALGRIGGDAELLAEVTAVYMEESAAMIDSLRDAVDAADPEAIRRAAHSIKGALLSIGAEPAAEAALAVERCGATRDLALVRTVLRRLEGELARLRHELGGLKRA